MESIQPTPTDDTRERIMAAAAEIFVEKGYARATTRSIAEAAGVNEVTLFRHFGSKRNLLSEIVHQYSPLPDLTSIIVNQLSGDYRQDLLHLGTVFLNTLTQRKEALRLILCEAHEIPELREVIVQIPDQLRQVLTRYFQAKIQEGSIRDLNPALMAQGFLGMFFSYAIAREMLGSEIAPEVPTEDLVAKFVDIFIHGTLPS
jgi:AcrR family transcriptional regulator